MSPEVLDPPQELVVDPQENVNAESATEEKESAIKLSREEFFYQFARSRFEFSNVDWTVFFWMTAIHVGCLAAPFYFNWTALAVAIGLHWLTCSVGICWGYHRYLSHRSMKLAKPVEFLVLLCGALSGEGSPLTWAATHRLHHQRSDKSGDPHSPLHGPFWSHMLWLFMGRRPAVERELYERYVPDLTARPMLWFFERTYVPILLGSGAALYFIGEATGIGGMSLLLWGLCVRMVVAYHTTWLINSATHIWGYRNYDTTDESRNLWWVAIMAYGEGWHNNHHAHPSLAPAGHRWWEVDITWWSIRLCRALGLAWDVKDNVPCAGVRTTTEDQI